MEQYFIGIHTEKCPTYFISLKNVEIEHMKTDLENLENIKNFWNNFPIQIFTGSNKGWKVKIPDKVDVEKTSKYIVENNISAFIHTCYLINLSRTGTTFEKAKERLVNDLKIGAMLNFKGVVVHVGKAVEKLTEEIGTKNMHENIISILPEIDEKCPVLVETPAGQGTEICSKIENFMKFYEMFSEDERKKVKICIDTCHIFASGYEPMEYIVQWYSKFPDSIALVHWNDSKCKKGSKKDRHASAGDGFIGLEKMEEIAIWCTEKRVPMIIE